MPFIELIRISNHICCDTSLTVNDGEFLVLAGTTGAGKTTLLNVVAGLTAYRGSVRFDNKAVDDLPPARRHVGYLFQEFALFPNMTVYGNIAFGLQAASWEKRAINTRVHELLAVLNIEPLKERYPRSLSGGEKQRVALARTLAPRPSILLLDEPFSNLDPRTARFLRLELKNLHKQLGLTAIYVTHNQKEAFEMGDRIAVVSHGRIEQVSEPNRILFDPQTPVVSELFGALNIFKCQSVDHLHVGLGKARCNGLTLIVPYEGMPIDKLAVLPSGIHVSKYPDDKSSPNRMQGQITSVRRKPPIVRLDIHIKKTSITAELPEFIWDDMNIDVLDTVYTTIPLKWIQVLEA